MKILHLQLAIVTLLFTQRCQSKILRNNALMNKMMVSFHKENNMDQRQAREYRNRETEQQLAEPRKQDMPPSNHIHSRIDPQVRSPDLNLPLVNMRHKGEHIKSLMQNVLCNNFPTVPCEMITKDEALTQLIERSIQQISFRQYPTTPKTTVPPYPVVNSEDLSNFLEVSNTGYFKAKPKDKEKGLKKMGKMQNRWTQDREALKKIDKIKGKADTMRSEVYNSGRKKMRKFYPHKMKFKDKKEAKDGYREYSQEKFSMSVEIPDMKRNARQTDMTDKMAYKVEPVEDPALWRIDYMKHTIPSTNMYREGGYEDRLSGKIMKSANVRVDDNVLEQGTRVRKEVLHPDVYIKKSFARKGSMNLNSEGMNLSR